MEEIVKDAPCLCKEDWQDEAKTTMKLDFFKKIQFHLLRLQKSCFAYPVMYEDGTVSTEECDKIGRTPIGIIFENHLLSLKVSQNEMPWNEAMEYCRSVKLLGKECEAGTIKLWYNIRGGRKKINNIFYSLGVKPLSDMASFWTSENSGKSAATFCMLWGICGGSGWSRQNERSFYVFPMLDLSDEYAYPVMYDDGTISTLKKDKIGRTPLGIIFENHLITMKNSPYRMPWTEAMNYCKSIKLLGEECEAGTVEFWNNLAQKIEDNMNAIFSSLGGNVLGNNLCWTSTDYGNDNHFKARYWYNGIGGCSKDKTLSVRPVLDLSKAVSKRKKLAASL